MNETMTAEWQIRNGVYPITHAALEPIVERIAVIENFFVHLSGLKANNVKSLPGPGQYDFERAASSKMTVAKWREIRFGKCYPMLSAQVVDQDGRILADDELVSGGRGSCEWTSNSILTITAWNKEKPHTDDEALLEALSRELSRFPFIGPIAVRRTSLLWRLFHPYELEATTKPLTLRAYEYGILKGLIKAVIAPGFQHVISRSQYSGDQPPQPRFLSQNLNEVFIS